MNLEKISYQELLKHIDNLRSKGLSDNDPEMQKAKWKLRDFLENKKEKSTSLVPKLKSVKTVMLSQAPEDQGHNKFVILGVVFAVAAILFSFKRFAR